MLGRDAGFQFHNNTILAHGQLGYNIEPGSCQILKAKGIAG
jgi:hypothetical protein